MIKKIINFLLYPFIRYNENQKFKKRIAELKNKDPFIYK
jgi:hypothetical protein